MKNQMTADEAKDCAYRLEEIRDQMKELLDEAREVVRGTPEEMRATAYWIGHISGALDREEYPSGSMITMEETENAFRNDEEA